MKNPNTDIWVIFKGGQVFLINAATFEKDIKQVLTGRYAKWRVKRVLQKGTPEDALKYLVQTNRIQSYRNGVAAVEFEGEIIRPVTPPSIIAPFLFLIPKKYREEYIGDLSEMLEELQQTGMSGIELGLVIIIEFFSIVFNIKKEEAMEWYSAFHSSSSKSWSGLKTTISRVAIFSLKLFLFILRYIPLVIIIVMLVYALSSLSPILDSTEEIPGFFITPILK